MLFIIITQKNRRVEEICYDTHSPTGVHRTYTNGFTGNNNYKRNEKILKTVFILYFVTLLTYALTVTGIQMGCTNMLNIPIIYPYLTLTVSCINLTIKTATFIIL